jgi:hypothetical protein
MNTLILEGPLTRIEIGNGPNIWEAVRSLRRRVFCQEEGYLADMIETPLDRLGVHIVIRHDEEPLACVSVIPPEYVCEFASDVGLPKSYIGRAALITKMAVISEYRKSNLSTLMTACLEHLIFGPKGYRYGFVVLRGRHCLNEPLYQRLTGAERVAEGECAYGKQVVLIMDRECPIYQGVKKSILDVQIAAFTKEHTPRGGDDEVC